MEETKIIYYLEEQETPYLVKLNIALDKVKLKDFKNALNRQNYKYFFKSMDDDFGVVKEEVIDDDAHLPGYNGRVIAWLISTEGSVTSETKSQHSLNLTNEQTNTSGNINTPTINTNNSDYNIEHGRNAGHSLDNHQNYRKSHHLRDLNDDTTTETESISSQLKEMRLHRSSSRRHYNSFNHHLHNQHRRSMKANMMQQQHYKPYHHYDASSLMSSDLDTTTFFDTENDDQYSSVTESTMSSKRYGLHRKKRLKHKLPSQSDTASSVSGFTESTMSLNIITVILNMDTLNFLGISIVGQSNKGSDGGIYVGSIMQGGAVAEDGRIEPGDMILQVNDISFENMSNEDAVKVLREAVTKPGPIKLVVAKCWDPNPQGYFTVSKQEPIKPIDPTAWVQHTAAMTGQIQHNGRYIPPPATAMSSFGSTSSLANSMAETETRYGNDQLNLTVNTDMETVVRAMSAPDSGLDIRDRNWLKITIQNAFIGSDVVDWLFNHVEGFPDRRDARKYACNLLKNHFIKQVVNKMRFSEQCYYVFGDPSGCGGSNGTLFTLNEESEDFDSVSEYDRDTLCSGIMGPLQPVRNNMLPPLPPSYLSTTSSTNASSFTAASTTTSGIVTQTEKNYQLYYPPSHQNRHYHQQQQQATPNSIISSSIIDNTDNHTYVTSGINSNYTSAVSISQSNYNTQSVYSNNSGGSRESKSENRSIKSSNSNSSSGNGSDTELLSNKRSNSKLNKLKNHNNISQQTSTTVSYQFKSHLSSFMNDSTNTINSYQQLANFERQSQAAFAELKQNHQQQQQQRSLDKVPAELRTSKQSFQMAMTNPCEYFVDVM